MLRKPSKKGPATKPASWYKKKCDTLFSKKVRARGKCERCGAKDNLQCSHIISRTVMNLRYDPDNALCLCVACHIYWWHREPLEASQWFNATWPGRYERLLQRKNVGGKILIKEMYEVLKGVI